MSVVFDTGVISRFLTGNVSIINKIEKLGVEYISISVVTKVELLKW